MNPVHTGCHYIQGDFHTGQGEVLHSYNPFDDTLLWSGTKASPEEIVLSVRAAVKALVPWSMQDFKTRAEYCESFAAIVEAKKNELAQIISQESGKPLWEAYTEVAAVIGKAALSIKAYNQRTSIQNTPTPDALGWVRYKPLGVMLVLGPFNFPAHLSNGHIVPALLAGNTVLYKPSELTPAVAQFMMSCWHEAGLPPGVIQCLQGDSHTAQALLSQDIQGVLFTGSHRAGLSIHQRMNTRPEVLLALEMGGNNPLIIGETADLRAAVYNTILSAYISAGQRCSCARRLIVPKGKKGDAFLDLLSQTIETLKIGPYTDSPEPFMGPVISAMHAETHLHAEAHLIALGAKPLIPMRQSDRSKALLLPGLIDMTEVTQAPDEEIFAPLLQLYRYHDFDEALKIANQTRFGLAAGLLSDNEQHYERFYQTIRAGIVNWNRPTTGASSALPFGGIGLSGNHRPSAYHAADYCAYPVASLENNQLTLPTQRLNGITL